MQTNLPVKPNSITRNGLWSVSVTVWNIGVMFVVTPILVSGLGDEHYGIVAIVMSLLGLMSLAQFGVGEAGVRFAARYYARGDIDGVLQTFSGVMLLSLFSGGAVTLVMTLSANQIVDFMAIGDADKVVVSHAVLLVGVAVLFLFVGNAFLSVSQGLQRFEVGTAARVVQTSVQGIGAALAVTAGLGVLGAVTAYVVGTAIFCVWAGYGAKKLLPALRFNPLVSLKTLREISGFSVYSGLSQVLNVVWREGDRLILAATIGASAVGYLVAPSKIALQAQNGVAALGAGLFPRISALTSDAAVRELFLLSSWLLCTLSVAIFAPLIVLMPSFLSLWINPTFSESSAYIGQVVALSCLLRGVSPAYHGLLRGVGKPQILTAVLALAALTSFSLNIALIPRFGLHGAGYAYIATALLGLGATGYTWRIVLKQNSWAPLARVVGWPMVIGLVAVVIGTSLIQGFDNPSWLGLILIGSIFSSAVLATCVLVELLNARDGGHAINMAKRLSLEYSRRSMRTPHDH